MPLLSTRWYSFVYSIIILYSFKNNTQIDEIINGAIFHEKYDEMVTVLDIDYFSMCETSSLTSTFNGSS